jgi:hypothetical protein
MNRQNAHPSYMPNKTSYFDERGCLALAALQAANANQSMYFPQVEGSYLAQTSLPVPLLPDFNPSGTVQTPDTPRAGPSSQQSATTPTTEERVAWEADLLEALSAQGQTPIPNQNNANITELVLQLETSQRPEVVRFQPFGLRSQRDPRTFYYPISPASQPFLFVASNLLRGLEGFPPGVVGFIRVHYGKYLNTHHRGRKPRPANFTEDRGRGRPS